MTCCFAVPGGSEARRGNGGRSGRRSDSHNLFCGCFASPSKTTSMNAKSRSSPFSVSNLRPEDSLQLELPLDSPNLRRKEDPRAVSVVEASRWGVDRSVDRIRDKFGRAAVGYATAALSATGRVPEEFRELAERGQGR